MFDFLLFLYILYLKSTAGNRHIILQSINIKEGDIFATNIDSSFGMNVYIFMLMCM